MYELSMINQNEGGLFSVVPTGITAYFDGSKYFLHPVGNTPIETAVLLKRDPSTREIYAKPWDPNEDDSPKVTMGDIFSANSLSNVRKGSKLNAENNYPYCFSSDVLQTIDRITKLDGVLYSPDELILLVVDILQEHPVFPSVSGKSRKTTPEDILFILEGITREGISLSEAVRLMKNEISTSDLYSIMVEPHSSIRKLVSLYKG